MCVCVCFFFLICNQKILMRNNLQRRLGICIFIIFSLTFFKEHLPDNDHNTWPKHVKGGCTEYDKSTYF